MLPCSSCGRFVREESRRCPFCDAKVGSTRAPVASVFGVLLGVCLAACGGKDDGEDTTAGDGPTATMTDSGNDSIDDATSAQPLYGPVIDTDSNDGTTDPGGTGSSTGTPPATTGDMDSTGGTGGQATGTDTGDATLGSEGAEPLYGAVMTTSD